MNVPQYAPVGPVSALRRLAAQEDLLGYYQLLIAPIVLMREEAYRNFFTVHDDQFIIMDNGVIEQGYPLSPEKLYRAVQTVGAQLVVLPDTIDDAKATIAQVRKALPEYRRLDTVTDALGVVQGTTFEECMECARILVEEGVDWLAIPRGLTPHLGTRIELTQAVGNYGKPMHILGFSDNIKDDILTAVSHPLVRGIDAATPIWFPRALPPTPPSEAEATLRLGRRPKDFWNNPASAAAEESVRRVRGWLTSALAQNTAKDAPIPEPKPVDLTDR